MYQKVIEIDNASSAEGTTEESKKPMNHSSQQKQLTIVEKNLQKKKSLTMAENSPQTKQMLRSSRNTKKTTMQLQTE